MKKIEKALNMMEEFNFPATIVNDKLYITAWNKDYSDTADFVVSKADIDKWAADYDINRRGELLSEMRDDLLMIYRTIDAINKDVFEMEHIESFPLKTLLSNIDCHLDELNKMQP